MVAVLCVLPQLPLTNKLHHQHRPYIEFFFLFTCNISDPKACHGALLLKFIIAGHTFVQEASGKESKKGNNGGDCFCFVPDSLLLYNIRSEKLNYGKEMVDVETVTSNERREVGNLKGGRVSGVVFLHFFLMCCWMDRQMDGLKKKTQIH